jgi:low affinity Fe/Cu permease
VASRDIKPANGPSLNSSFRQISKRTAEIMGTPAAFLGAVLVILIWAGSGPVFKFSDTWQLVINTATTIITFLMVFLIQNTQNRDSRAIHLKLDELIKAVHTARNSVIDLDRLTDEEMQELEDEYKKLCSRANRQPRKQP